MSVKIPSGYDIFGNLILVKFPVEVKLKDRKKAAEVLLARHKSVRTVVEKIGNFKGRLRKLRVRYLAGEKTLEVLYKENGCEFRFNVESCYFSSRLVTERKELAGKVKKGEEVLVMFGGVAPFAIAIAKHSKVGKVASVELSRACTKYAKENVKRNKVGDRVEVVGGDVRKKLVGKKKFDRVVMARPNLKDSFLDVGFRVVRKGGVIHYYGFYHQEDKKEMLEMVKSEAKKARKKIRVLKVKRAGDIAPGKFRWRVDLKIL